MIFLDTEFDGFGGRLISIGMVSDRGGEEFYSVLQVTAKEPWVQEHVLPFLSVTHEEWHAYRTRLIAYLRRHPGEPVVADWPEDLAHLLNSLCEPGGISFEIELDLRLILSGKLDSKVPHNALSDARALMSWHNQEVGIR